MRVVAVRNPLEGYAFQGMTFPAYIPALLAAGDGRGFLGLGAYDGAGEPAGLVLVRRGEPAELMSVFVREDLRRGGLASELLGRAGEALRLEGRRRVEASFERGRPGRAAAEALLRKAGFGDFLPTALMCRFHGAKSVSRLPWLRKLFVPAAFELFPWAELRAEERADIERRLASGEIPANLSPFLGERWLEPGNSLGLRFEGQVVAWQVNHRPVPRLLRYTTTFARRELQAHGIALALVAESIRRHLDGPLARETDGATFKVPAAYDAMTRIVDRRWRGYADEINEVVRCGKTLA